MQIEVIDGHSFDWVRMFVAQLACLSCGCPLMSNETIVALSHGNFCISTRSSYYGHSQVSHTPFILLCISRSAFFIVLIKSSALDRFRQSNPLVLPVKISFPSLNPFHSLLCHPILVRLLCSMAFVAPVAAVFSTTKSSVCNVSSTFTTNNDFLIRFSQRLVEQT